MVELTRFDYLKKILKDNKPPVIFKEEEHEYWLDDKQLNGITGRINDVLYGGKKYEGVPEYIMQRARERGSLVHKEIEEYVKNGVNGFTDELQIFKKIKEIYNFEVLESEYTVTDFEKFATNIDLILYINEVLALCDIKTTAQLDNEYLSWQLSINAYMLEKILKEKVEKLYVFWTRTTEFIEIERKTNKEVEEFLYSDIEYIDAQEKLELSKSESERFEALQNQIQNLKQQLQELETQENEFKNIFIEKMKQNNIKSFDLGNVKITYVAPAVRKSFDSKRLELENKEVYEQYLKESKVKESLRITVRS